MGLQAPAPNKTKTHCQKGHPLSGDNLRVKKRGDRLCRTCDKDGPVDKCGAITDNSRNAAAIFAVMSTWAVPLASCYDLTAPAVMPSIKRRCRNTKTSTTGNTIVTAAASIWPQSVEYCPVRL
jgi:hypothetical protein